jgi:hypothetical protein
METDAILAARVPSPQADEVREYVPRLELEAALEAYLKQPSSKAGAYLVVIHMAASRLCAHPWTPRAIAIGKGIGLVTYAV